METEGAVHWRHSRPIHRYSSAVGLLSRNQDGAKEERMERKNKKKKRGEEDSNAPFDVGGSELLDRHLGELRAQREE